jgi:hypothetical protein
MRVQFRCANTAVVLETSYTKSLSIEGRIIRENNTQIIATYCDSLGWRLWTDKKCGSCGEDMNCYATIEIGE